MQENMTVTRALSELKMLSVRIEKAMTEKFVGCVKGVEGKPLNKSDPDASTLQGNWASVNDMMKRRDAIKAAVVAANARTTVQVSGSAMTVAEAIERKRTITNKAQLLTSMKSQLLQFNNYIKTQNDALEAKIDQQVAGVYGKDSKKEIKDSDYQTIRKPMLDQHELRLLDPLDLASKVENLEKEIQDFTLNVDYALSEVNATTKIDVAY